MVRYPPLSAIICLPCAGKIGILQKPDKEYDGTVIVLGNICELLTSLTLCIWRLVIAFTQNIMIVVLIFTW